MLQKDRVIHSDFSASDELLYRRCDPRHIDNDHVLPIAVEQFNLSVLRSKFATPDHARWDSRVSARDEEKVYVYPDWLVIQFTVKDASLDLPPSNPDAQPHSLRPVHAPLQDNYAHCELAFYKGSNLSKRLAREGDVK